MKIVEDIKLDLLNLETKNFYTKYLVRPDNWYFKNILCIPQNKIMDKLDELKTIISEQIGVSYSCIAMVGSGKIGCSLAKHKLFQQFRMTDNMDNKKPSDIDIALISTKLYNYYWELFRHCYSTIYSYEYKYISRSIFRGYINDRNIEAVQPCRAEWHELVNPANRRLKGELFFKNDINYRIYRSWEDFEEYHQAGIEDIKKEVIKSEK